MIQYTTPSITIFVEGASIGQSDRVIVSFEQRCRHETVSFDVPASDVTSSQEGVTLVTATLTQAESGRLSPGDATAQVNWITSGGERKACEPVAFKVTRNLLDEVITYG